MAALNALLFFALIALVTLSLIRISLGWRTRVDERTGEFTLRYSLPLRVFAVFSGFAIPVALIVLVLLVPPWQPQDVFAAELLLLLFKSLGWLILTETFGLRVLVTDEGLVKHSAWRRKAQAIRWDEIVEVRHESPKAWFVFTTESDRLEVPLYVAGLDSLEAAIRQHLPAHVHVEDDSQAKRTAKR